MILLFRWEAKKACNRETVAGQREIEEREGFVISAAESTSKERLTEQYWESFSSDSPTENSFLMDEISENIFNEEHNKLFLGKIQIREDKTWLSFWWRSRIWSEEIQNTNYSSHSARSAREYICVADWRWRNIFIKNAMQEVAEKLKNWEYAAMRKEITEEKRRWEEFLTQHDQESRTVSLFFYDPDLLSSYDIPTFLIKLLLHRVRKSRAAKLECREIHKRRSVFLETFLIVNMLDENLMNFTMIQENWRYHWRFWEKKELRIVGAKKPLQSTPLPCFSVRARRKRLDDK